MADLAPHRMLVRLPPGREGVRRDETGFADGLHNPVRQRLDQAVVSRVRSQGLLSMSTA